MSERVVPLSNIQITVLRLLAAHRDPESYVADATPLSRNTARYPSDMDVFHDRAERVAAAALHDANVLETAGYRVAWLRQLPLLYTAEVTHAAASTRLEWVVDSDYRFFPTMRDELFGYVLHPVDLAMNNVLLSHQSTYVRARPLTLVHSEGNTYGGEILTLVPRRAPPTARYCITTLTAAAIHHTVAAQ